MSKIVEGLLYSDSHEWVKVDGDVAMGEVMGWEATVIPSCCRIVADAMSRYA